MANDIEKRLLVRLILVLLLLTTVGVAIFYTLRTCERGNKYNANEDPLQMTPIVIATQKRPLNNPIANNTTPQTSPDKPKTLNKKTTPVVPLLDPAFLRTPVAQKWFEHGVTADDIRTVTEDMLNRGFSSAEVGDPSLVAQFLPYRNITPARIQTIDLPASAAAGTPVFFKVDVEYPDPSYVFETWSVIREAQDITIRMLGHKSGSAVPAVVVSAKLDGQIPPLASGTYTVRFETIGPTEFKTLIIK